MGRLPQLAAAALAALVRGASFPTAPFQGYVVSDGGDVAAYGADGALLIDTDGAPPGAPCPNSAHRCADCNASIIGYMAAASVTISYFWCSDNTVVSAGTAFTSAALAPSFWWSNATASPVPLVFAYTGAPQAYTVPPGVSLMSVYLWGAGGGGSDSAAGGAGALVTGNLTVSGGETLRLIVGRGGGHNDGTSGEENALVGGGGGGGLKGGSGGGRTAVQRYTGGVWEDVVTAGGGGGGGGCASAGGTASWTGTATAGGARTLRGTCWMFDASSSGGSGGQQGGGGVSTYPSFDTTVAGFSVSASTFFNSTTASGTKYTGGNADPNNTAGGGGGGWYGGGATANAGGGGGSSHTAGLITGGAGTDGEGASAPVVALPQYAGSSVYIAPAAFGGAVGGSGGPGLVVLDFPRAPTADPAGGLRCSADLGGGLAFTTPCPSASPSPSTTASATPSGTVTASPTGTPTPTSAASSTQTPTPTTSPTPTSTVTPSKSPDPLVSESGTPTPSTSPSVTPTQSPTSSGTGTPTSSRTPTPTVSFTSSPSSVPSTTSTASGTSTSTRTATGTPTASTTTSVSSTPSTTPSMSGTPSTTPSESSTPSQTPTSSRTPSTTPSESGTPSTTPSMSGTPSNTPSNSGTPSTTASSTPTPSNTPSNSPTPSNTASQTPTPTTTPSPSSSPQLLNVLREREVLGSPLYVTVAAVAGGALLVGITATCAIMYYCTCCRVVAKDAKARDPELPIGRGRKLAAQAARLISTTSGRVLVALGASHRRLIPLASPVPDIPAHLLPATRVRDAEAPAPPDPRLEALAALLAAPDSLVPVGPDTQAFHLLFLGRPAGFMDWAISNAKAAVEPAHARVAELGDRVRALRDDPKVKLAFEAVALNVANGYAPYGTGPARPSASGEEGGEGDAALPKRRKRIDPAMQALLTLLESAEAKLAAAEATVSMYEQLLGDLRTLKAQKIAPPHAIIHTGGGGGGGAGLPPKPISWQPVKGACPVCGHDASARAAHASRTQFEPAGISVGRPGDVVANPLLAAVGRRAAAGGLEDGETLHDSAAEADRKKREHERLMSAYQPKHARPKGSKS